MKLEMGCRIVFTFVILFSHVGSSFPAELNAIRSRDGYNFGAFTSRHSWNTRNKIFNNCFENRIQFHSGREIIRPSIFHNHVKQSESRGIIQKITALSYSKGDEKHNSAEQRKMAMVRSIQSTFYSSPDEKIDEESNNYNKKSVQIDFETGTIKHLPIWRVGWTELVGRSNVLCVSDPSYTHMFEQIMRATPKPWYCGHLYLEGGNASLKKARMNLGENDRIQGEENFLENKEHDENKRKTHNNYIYNLKSWKEEIETNEFFGVEDFEIENKNESTNATTSKENSNVTVNTEEDLDDDYIEQKSSVVGTLLRIVDCRRMKDGKILLLVHALERFVVSHVHREFPYSITDVQLVPDVEETSYHWSQLKSKKSNLSTDLHFNNNDAAQIYEAKEDQISPFRAQSITESFQFYHKYEFDDMAQLPVKNGDISVSDVFGPYLKKVIPFAPYSPNSFCQPLSLNLQMDRFIDENNKSPTSTDNNEKSKSASVETQNKPESKSLEHKLVEGGILRIPPSHPEVHRSVNLSVDELEEQLWIQIDFFIRMKNGPNGNIYKYSSSKLTQYGSASKKKATISDKFESPINPLLLTLLPQDKKWPNHFILEDIATFLSNNDKSFVRISKSYPNYKRQKRLSFAASALVEHSPQGGGSVLRQILLEIPSTHARFW